MFLLFLSPRIHRCYRITQLYWIPWVWMNWSIHFNRTYHNLKQGSQCSIRDPKILMRYIPGVYSGKRNALRPWDIYLYKNWCICFVFPHWNGCKSKIWYQKAPMHTLRWKSENIPIFEPSIYNALSFWKCSTVDFWKSCTKYRRNSVPMA